MSDLLQVSADKSAEVPCAQADAQLMNRLAAGDPAAMQDLISAHGDWLARLVGRMSAWSSEQDDLLQEVLVSAWERADSYRGQGSLAGWLRMIAVNRCRNHHRAQRALGRMMDSAKALLGRHPAKTNDSLEAHELTQFALAQLSADDRVLVVLFYLEEVPGNEIADLLNIKKETLHVRLHRVRGRLRQVLERTD